MGVANPPGFPLYYLIGRLFTLIPVGDVAFRINIMSAFFGALAVVLIGRGIAVFLEILYSRERSVEGAGVRGDAIPVRWIAMFSCLFLSVTPVFWSQSLVAEEYALNAFLLSLLLLLSLQTVRLQRKDFFFLTSFVLGLSFSNHPLTLVFIPSFLFMAAMMVGKRRLSSPQWTFSLILLAVGLSCYLYIPTRATSATPILWYPIERIESLYHYLIAQKHHGEIFSSTLMGYVYKLRLALDVLVNQLTFAGCLILALGTWIALRKNWRPSLLVLLVAFLDVAIASYVKFNRHTISVYLIPALIVFTYLGGSGLLALWKISKQKIRGSIQVAIAVVILVMMTALNWKMSSRQGSYVNLSLGQDILRSLPSGATFVTEGDNATFSILYLQTVERERPDVRILAPEWMLFNKWKKGEKGPVFAFSQGQKNQKQRPYGIVYTQGQILSDPDNRALFDRFRLKDESPESLLEDEKVRFVAALYPERLGRYLLQTGRPKEGLISLQKASSIGGNISEVVHNNVGLAYREGGYYKKAENEFRMSLKINPLYPYAYLNLASMMMGLGRDKEAIEVFEKALKWSRGGKGLYINLGALYVKNQQYKKALAILQKGLLIYPKTEGIHYNLGLLYSKEGKLTLSEGAFRKALLVRPNFSLARKQLAGLLIRLGRYGEGEEHYREALKLKPQDVEILNGMGGLAIWKGDLKRAHTLFKRSLSINPNQPEVHRVIERLGPEFSTKGESQ
jgi:tetratricopeptide (TPR) repeat protein